MPIGRPPQAAPTIMRSLQMLYHATIPGRTARLALTSAGCEVKGMTARSEVTSRTGYPFVKIALLLSFIFGQFMALPLAGFAPHGLPVAARTIDKAYDLREPFGEVRIVRQQRELSITSHAFQTTISAEEWAGLQGPDWEGMRVLWLHAPLHWEKSDRPGPRLVVQVPLRPRGGNWQWWAQYHFDVKGHFERLLHVRVAQKEETEVYWAVWPIGSGHEARDVYQEAAENSIGITITGAFNSPGKYRLSRGATALDAVGAAGGLTRLTRNLEIIYQGEDGEVQRSGRIPIRSVVREALPAPLPDGAIVVGSDTCVAEGTLLETPQGAVPVEQLRQGDLVLSYDFDLNETVFRRITAIASHLADETVVIDGRLRVTPEHRIWDGAGWTHAADLVPGVSLLTPTGAFSVSRIERKSAAITVYSLSVEGTRNFFADGILVHNKI
jgi:hypothetical protein